MSKLVDELREENEQRKKERENAELEKVSEQYSSSIREVEDNFQKLNAEKPVSNSSSITWTRSTLMVTQQ